MTAWIKDHRTGTTLHGPYESVGSARRAFTSRKLDPATASVYDDEWRIREEARERRINIESFGLTAIPNHFLHVSMKSSDEDLMVSYTETEEKGQRNLQKAGQKIGKYLAAFYPTLNAVQVQSVAAAISNSCLNLNVHFARTRGEIRWVYEHSRNNAASCMTYGVDHYDSNPIMPVEAYEGPDLAVAYITNGEKSVSARALVWPEKKRWNRIYGTGASKLQAHLTKLGYKQGSLAGARMTPLFKNPKRDDTPSRKMFVVPYTDNDRYVHFDGTHIVIGTDPKGKIQAYGTATNGLVTMVFYVSEVSGKPLSPGNVSEIAHPFDGRVVYLDPSEVAEHTEMVGATRQHRYLKSNNLEHYVADGRGKLFPLHYASRNFRQCYVTGKNYDRYEMRSDHRGNSICLESFIRDYAICEVNGSIKRRIEMLYMDHKAWWSAEAFNNHGVTVDNVNYAKWLAPATPSAEKEAA